MFAKPLTNLPPLADIIVSIVMEGRRMNAFTQSKGFFLRTTHTSLEDVPLLHCLLCLIISCMIFPLGLGMSFWWCSWCNQSRSLIWFGIVLAPGWELFSPLLWANSQIESAEIFLGLSKLINVGQFFGKCSARFFPATNIFFLIILCVPVKESRDIVKSARDTRVLGEVLLWIYHWGWELLWEDGRILCKCGCGYSWCCSTEMEMGLAVRISYRIYNGILMCG